MVYRANPSQLYTLGIATYFRERQHFVPIPCHSAPNFEADFLCKMPSRHLAQRTCSNEALSPFCFLLCLRCFFLSPIHFSLSAQKKFITNFVTHITNFVIRVTNFLTHVTKFVTKTILYERKNYQAEKKNYLLKRKNYHGDTRGGHARQT